MAAMDVCDREGSDLVHALSPLLRARYPDETVMRDLCERLSDHTWPMSVVLTVFDESQSPWLITGPDERLQELAASQYTLGEGPCLDAARTGEPVWARCGSATGRWPRWVPDALEKRIDAIVSLPVLDDAETPRTLGTVWMAIDDPDWLDEPTLQAAFMVATTAIRFAALHRELAQRTNEAAQLQQALTTRIVIEQAKGFLAAQHRISVEAAFDRMRQFARSRQRRLHDVAREVLLAGGLPES
jgi:transcriptional regulator with GAF, ATPase, and Fis domain